MSFEEEIVKIVTNRLFSFYIPTEVIKEYEIKNLAWGVANFTKIYINELNKQRLSND